MTDGEKLVGDGTGGAAWLGVAAAALALLVPALTGCANQAGVEAHPGGWVGQVGADTLRAGADTVRGVVRQVGNVPFHRTVIQTENGGFAVAGELEPEVTQLVGAEVRATGARKPGGPYGPELDVSAYEIVSVDGEVPYVGVLESDGDGYVLRTVSGGDLRLAYAPERFESLKGGRVWVTVDERGSVLRYGVLREPADMPRTDAS